MTQTSIWPKRIAILVGVTASALALTILLADLAETGKPTLKHVLAPGILVITILAAKLRGAAWAQGRVGAAGGLALLVMLGTALIVHLSVGRQSATADAETAAVIEHNRQRTEASRMLAEARDILAPCPKGREAERGVRCGLREAQAAECASGKGKRCDGRQYSVTTYEAAIAGYEARLRALGPERVVAPTADRMAEVIAVLTGADKARVKSALVLIEPFAATLFLELGAILAFGFAFGATAHGSANGSDVEAEPSRTVRIEEREANGSTATPEKPHGSAPAAPVRTVRPVRSGRYSRAEAEAELVTMLAMGRTIPAQKDLVAKWGVGKATVSDWMRAWDAAGLTRRETVGKCKRITAAR